jgi:hypothetical protein
MPLQASQAVPEKPRNRGGEDQEQISQKSACDWNYDRRPSGRRSLSIGEREVQKKEFRSCRSSGVAEWVSTPQCKVVRASFDQIKFARVVPGSIDFKTAEQLVNSATPELLT